MDNVPKADNTTKVQVQHVTKKSSDELLRKFAELGDDEDDEKKWKRRKRSAGRRRRRSEHGDSCESPSRYSGNASSIVERRSLLPNVNKRSLLLVKIGKSHLRGARDMRNKSILAGIEKTWRLTVEGASRILLEKHYSRHRRLINDVI